ncbi:FAM188B [Bugula neritina]|uniref:FAM188B n=1 Tax=Bugula neritina TaxID=10212 RepID=A0A7J7J9B1_BUGNE|nr:FAM188B [Bugula neritina]
MALSFIESLSIALVREFLKRKGLTSTYQTLDVEFPKDDDSITNRTELAKYLHIEKLLKQNKEEGSPLRTMLEIIAKYLAVGESEHYQKEVLPTQSHPQVRTHSARPKRSKITLELRNGSPIGKSANGGLVIEDDLETEQMIGRGLDDIINRTMPMERSPSPPTRMKSGKIGKQKKYSHRQSSGEATRSVYLKKPPDLPADGESEETPAVTSQIVSEHGDAAEDTAREVSCTKPVIDSCDEPHVAEEVKHNSFEGTNATPRDPVIGCQIEAHESQTVDASSNESHSNSVSDSANQLQPKPPEKVVSAGKSPVKSNIEKSIELLRQRRLMQQRAQSILESAGNEEETEHVPDYKNEAVVEPKAISTSAGENTEEEEESYSPRIISSPVAVELERSNDGQPPLSGDEASASKTETTTQEETVSKRPSQFLAVKEVISSAKPIDVQTAMVC